MEQTSIDPPEKELSIAAAAGRRLKLCGLRIGSTVSQAVAASIVGSAGQAALPSLAADANLTFASQLGSIGLIAVKVPLQAGGRMEQFAHMIGDYAARHQHAVSQLCAMPVAEQIMTVGVRGNVIAAVATAAVQEAITLGYYFAGASAPGELASNSLMISLSGMSTVAGGAAGAAVGTLCFPGIGTALGSLLGSFGGAYLPLMLPPMTEEEAFERQLAVKEVEGGDWLEVYDVTASFVMLKPTEREKVEGEILKPGSNEVVILFEELPAVDGVGSKP